MASIETRRSKDGKVTRYRVKWRTGGTRDGAWDGATLDSLAEAKRFRGLVETCRHQFPSNDQLVEYGFSHLVPGGVAPTPQPAEAEVATPPVTFESYARDYIAALVRPNPETKRKYLERLALHVFPAFGSRPIAEITRREVREWQEGLIGSGLSAKTIANIRGETVVPIFDAACRPGEDEEPPLRSYNPVHGLKMPPIIRRERDILENAEETRIFIAAAYAVDVEAAELLVTILATGLRWGEIAGLAPRAVHQARGTISIQQVIRRECGTYKVIPMPKTPQGYREVPVPAEVMAILQRRCAVAGRQFVFTAPRGGHWRYDNFSSSRLAKIRALAQKNGLPRDMTPHGLRHSLLTLLATEGIDLDGLRQIAGHKHISTTFDVYVHHTRKHHEPVRRIVTGFVAPQPCRGDEDDPAGTPEQSADAETAGGGVEPVTFSDGEDGGLVGDSPEAGGEPGEQAA